jgi:hypothetical protein
MMVGAPHSFITHYTTVSSEMSCTDTPTTIRVTHDARAACSFDMHLAALEGHVPWLIPIATERSRCTYCVTNRKGSVATRRVVVGVPPSHIPHYTTQTSISHMCTVWSQNECWLVLRIHSSYITHHAVFSEMSRTNTPTTFRVTRCSCCTHA